MSNYQPMKRTAVRLLVPWNGRRAGVVIPQMDSRIANDLINHGRAEAYTEPEPEPEPEPEVKKPRKSKKKTTEEE